MADNKQSQVQTKRGSAVNIFVTGAAAIGLTFATCLAIMPLEKMGAFGHRIWEICLNRGAVSPGTIFLTYWALAILAVKIRKVQAQRASLSLDLLPLSLGQFISKANVDAFLKHIASLPVKAGESEYVERTRRALDFFKARNNRQEVEGFLKTQQELDGTALTQSYSMVNVLSWAIPILGFIGTVEGIAVAVSGFEGTMKAATEIGVLKESLSSVTEGLAIAFDTTLIGLVLSLVVVFPAKIMEKSEEEILAGIEDNVNENLLKRLMDPAAAGSEDHSKDWVKNAVAAAMANQEAQFRGWTQTLQEAGTSLMQKAVEGWNVIDQRIRESIGQQASQFKASQDAAMTTFTKGITTVNQTAITIQEKITELQETQVHAFEDTVEKLQENLQSLQEESHQKNAKEVELLQKMATQFAESLNNSQKQIEREQGEWNKYFQNIGDSITQKLVAGWEGIDGKLQASLKQQLEGIQGVAVSLAEQRKSYAGDFKAMQEQAFARTKSDADAIRQMTMEFAEALKTLQQHAVSVEEGFQQQAVAAQSEWTKHFDNIGTSITKRVTEGWEQIDQKLREGQGRQVQQLNEAIASLGEQAARIGRQMSELQQLQSENLKESVTQIGGTLKDIQGSAKTMQNDISEAVRGSGPILREELQKVVGSVAESFREQLKSLGSIKDGIDQSTQKFIGRLEDIRTMHQQSLTETMNTLKESARNLQKDVAGHQEQPLNRLTEIAGTLAEQARNIQREMDSSREVMKEEARKAVDQYNRAREDAMRAAGEQVTQFNANAERMLNTLNQTAEKAISSLTRSIEATQGRLGELENSRKQVAEQELAALKAEHQAAERAATEQLAKITGVATQLVNSMTDSQKKMGDQVNALLSVMQSQEQLTTMQKLLAQNMEMIATSDDFKQTLAGIDRGLNGLHPVLKDLSDRAGIAYTEPTKTDGHGTRKWWSLNRK